MNKVRLKLGVHFANGETHIFTAIGENDGDALRFVAEQIGDFCDRHDTTATSQWLHSKEKVWKDRRV